MIFRQIADAIRRQDLATVGIELAVLAVGVALGLQVDDWAAERQERALEQTLITRLTTDFERIELRLVNSLAQYDQYLSAIIHVRGRLELATPPESSEERERFLSALGDIMASRIPAGRSPTFVEMISSGTFDALQDRDLKRTLVDYDQDQSVAILAWQALRDQSLQFSEPILYAMTLVPPEIEADMINPGSFDFDRMRSDPLFDRALGVQISVQANNRRLQAGQLEAAQTILELLRSDTEEEP